MRCLLVTMFKYENFKCWFVIGCFFYHQVNTVNIFLAKYSQPSDVVWLRISLIVILFCWLANRCIHAGVLSEPRDETSIRILFAGFVARRVEVLFGDCARCQEGCHFLVQSRIMSEQTHTLTFIYTSFVEVYLLGYVPIKVCEELLRAINTWRALLFG